MVANNFDEAFIIFERMNDRGIELTTGDKIKHLFFQILMIGQEYLIKSHQN